MLLEKMKLKDKIAYCSGGGFWDTKKMPRYGIEAMRMCDGPHGLRKQENAEDMLGVNEAVPATCFPTAVLTACSWDETLLDKIGEALGREAAANGVGLLLGPGANIKRNPLCGRNFEYFSEDPYLTGRLAAAWIRAVEKTGVGSSLKHFALNNQEYKRFSSDSVADERTMREIYLSGFETAVKEGKPATVMCAYNRVNGVHCSGSRQLLKDILRDEWGFDGAVVTDWGAMSNRVESFQVGCDLNMPGGSCFMEKEAIRAVKKGKLQEADVDRSTARILRLVEQGHRAIQNALPVNMLRHHQLAALAATESAVLMKNEGEILPLSPQAKITFFGHMAKEIRYQGAGSSHITPWKVTSVAEAFPGIEVVPGCDENGDTTDALLQQAEAAAKNTEICVVFAGLTDRYESEGFDRENMHMPEGHDRLIETVSAANPNTVVVLISGSAVEVPWVDRVKAILYMGLPGEAGSEAVRDLLFGKAVPCGKLAETWPIRYEHCVSSSYYKHRKKDAHYREGLYVGYRYYTSAAVPVRFPFGHGLSYTDFSYSDLQIHGDTVTCKVKNTGKYRGKEVVQLYIAPPEGKIYRPVLELKGFQKIDLAPGEEQTVAFRLSRRSFAVWCNGWVVPGGTYRVFVGKSSADLPLSGEIQKTGEDFDPPFAPNWYKKPVGAPTHAEFEEMLGHAVLEKVPRKGEFTMDNSIEEMKKDSLLMFIAYKGVEWVVSRNYNGKKDRTDATFRMLMNASVDASLSGIKISGAMNNSIIEGALEIANGHFWRGLRIAIFGR